MATIEAQTAERIFNEMLYAAGIAWNNADRALLATIGPDGRQDEWAQGVRFGFHAAAEQADWSAEYAGSLR